MFTCKLDQRCRRTNPRADSLAGNAHLAVLWPRSAMPPRLAHSPWQGPTEPGSWDHSLSDARSLFPLSQVTNK